MAAGRHDQFHDQCCQHAGSRYAVPRHRIQPGEAADQDEGCQQPEAIALRLDPWHRAPIAQADREQQPREVAYVAVAIEEGSEVLVEPAKSREHAGSPGQDRYERQHSHNGLQEAELAGR